MPEELAAEEGAASDALLSDMAWAAAVGRSHLDHRAGVLFQGADSLRHALSALANADDGPGPRAATKVAFAYTGETDGWVGMGAGLYESEPVFRAVLDRCEGWLRDERGEPLLEVMFGQAGAEGVVRDPAWARAAVYALACALTALWASVGVRPSVVTGLGVGEIAAAQAAALFSLEDGLRLAAAGTDIEAALKDVAIAAPSIGLVSGLTGRIVEPDRALDEAYWGRQAAGAPHAIDGCARTLAEAGVDVVIEVGPDAALAPLLAEAWPKTAEDAAAPTVLPSLRRPSGGEAAVGSGDNGFVEAVAGAYEAGLVVSFAGLFAGETRRRISLPGYPFQRRRFWLPKSGARDSAPA